MQEEIAGRTNSREGETSWKALREVNRKKKVKR